MRRASYIVPVALVLLAVWFAVSSAIGVWRNFSPVPFWDQWRGYIDFYMHADGWSAYWAPHNEHRIIVSKLIFWADNRWFGGRNVLSLVANYALLMVLCAAFCWRGARYLREPAARLALVGVVGVLMFSWVQWENLIWAFQSQWYAVSLFALLAFMCIERGEEWRWIAGAVAFAALSMGSMANGLIAFPMLVVLALYMRMEWKRVAVLALVCAFAVAAYTYHLHNADYIPLSYALHTMPREVARFVILYMGGPMWGARQSLRLTFVFGGLWLFGAVLVVAMMVVRYRDPRRLQASAIAAMAGFIFLTAVVTALGRVPLLGSGVAMASRYESAALVGWVALLIFFAANCATRFQLALVGAAALTVVALVAPYQDAALKPMAERTFKLNAGGLALRAGVFDSPLVNALNDDHALLVDVAARGSAQGLSIFANPSRDYPEPVAPVLAAQPCVGMVDSSVKASEKSALAQINGWAYGPGGAPAAHIVITDPAGTPIGYGIGGEPRPDQATGHSDDRSGWVALFAPRADYKVVVTDTTGQRCFVQHEPSSFALHRVQQDVLGFVFRFAA